MSDINELSAVALGRKIKEKEVSVRKRWMPALLP